MKTKQLFLINTSANLRMGFDFTIHLVVSICPSTGQPFIYTKGWEKLYEIPKLEIPEEYRQFLQDRGRLYHAYTEYFNQNDRNYATTEELVETFPKWEEVKGSDWYEGYTEDDWSEQTHKLFYEALQWFTEQPHTFLANWSY